MGVSIDLYKYNYPALVESLMKIEGVNDKQKLEKILSKCGEIFGDTYLILNNEYYEDGNPYYGVASLIDSAFGIEDSFDVFLEDRQHAIDYISPEDIAGEVGFEIE
jgi:hypothetical protein